MVAVLPESINAAFFVRSNVLTNARNVLTFPMCTVQSSQVVDQSFIDDAYFELRSK